MKLSEKQQGFSLMIAELIIWGHANGYALTFGDAYRDIRCTYGHPESLHRSRLAVDFNLFIDGKYQTTTEAFTPLGEYWESIGGAWGGRFSDGNHFSLEHKGMR